jgi:hypothetical protein
VNNDSYSPLADKISEIWTSLSNCGYAITDEDSIGLPQKFRENFGPTYFNNQILRHDQGDWPADRERARDVIRYWWREDSLELKEFERITITDRADIPGTREHSRITLLEDPLARELVSALLCLVPPQARQLDGTFGINLFRTFTNVVTTPHHDYEEYIILYVMNRIGEGAETYLYQPSDVDEYGAARGEPILRRQLDPGQIIIFKDDKFKHGATPLVPPLGGRAMRDVLICTVDYHGTYLRG